MYDAIGPGYTLLRFDRTLEVSAFGLIARERGNAVPVDVDIAALLDLLSGATPTPGA